jgi:hypothetical protein
MIERIKNKMNNIAFNIVGPDVVETINNTKRDSFEL